MTFPVWLTDDAALDLEALLDYIERHDSVDRADFVLDQIEKVLESLGENPQRGVIPKELQDIGMREYRELFFKPYRIIYRIMDERVIVFIIADGRRDMQSLLLHRLLRA